MRIAVLTSSYPRFAGDGTAPFVQSISEYLVKLGHQVEVVAPYDPSVEREYSATLPVHRFRYICPERLHIMGHAKALKGDVRLRPLVYLLLPFFLLSAFVKLYRIVQRQNSQIIHVHWVLPNGPVAALVVRIRRIPLVISLHGSDIYIAQKNRIFSTVARVVFKQASAVSACSQWLKQSAEKLGAAKGIHLITWGADPEIFRPRPKDKVLLKKLGLTRGNPCVLALGRLVHKKGFDVLIRAWAKVCPSFPSARLIIAGEGPLSSTLQHQAQTSDVASTIRFPGRIPWDRVPDYLACADVFVLPSTQDKHGNIDGLPTVLLEAMSCGLPVIASQIGGISEVIQHPKNALLVPPGDEVALASSINDLLGNPSKRTTLGHEARESVKTNLNWQQVAEELYTLFDESIRRASA